MFAKKNNNKQSGFTIIEVMIVLAIAGLILGIVLVAIPQLQRNQRNEARKNVLARVATEVNNYVSNNEGSVPTEDTNATTGFVSLTGGFHVRYILNAPSGTFDKPGGGAYSYVAYGASTSVAQDVIAYNAGATCSGELPSGAGTARQFAIAVGLEGGASFCVDNS